MITRTRMIPLTCSLCHRRMTSNKTRNCPYLYSQNIMCVIYVKLYIWHWNAPRDLGFCLENFRVVWDRTELDKGNGIQIESKRYSDIRKPARILPGTMWTRCTVAYSLSIGELTFNLWLVMTTDRIIIADWVKSHDNMWAIASYPSFVR